ncbi:MAG: hypothetical protein Q9223_000492, partial [Gallowayella weberi]
VVTETQISYPYVLPSSSFSTEASSTLTDTTAPSVPPGTVVEQPKKGEAKVGYEAKTSSSLFALVVVAAFLV